MLRRCVENKELYISENEVKLYAHNIYVPGQMWSFRRWELRKMFTLEEYIELQTDIFNPRCQRDENGK